MPQQFGPRPMLQPRAVMAIILYYLLYLRSILEATPWILGILPKCVAQMRHAALSVSLIQLIERKILLRSDARVWQLLPTIRLPRLRVLHVSHVMYVVYQALQPSIPALAAVVHHKDMFHSFIYTNCVINKNHTGI